MAGQLIIVSNQRQRPIVWLSGPVSWAGQSAGQPGDWLSGVPANAHPSIVLAFPKQKGVTNRDSLTSAKTWNTCIRSHQLPQIRIHVKEHNLINIPSTFHKVVDSYLDIKVFYLLSKWQLMLLPWLPTKGGCSLVNSELAVQVWFGPRDQLTMVYKGCNLPICWDIHPHYYTHLSIWVYFT